MKAGMKAAIVGALIAGVFAVAISTGTFNFPDPVPVVSGTTNDFCQKSLNFRGGPTADFTFSYKNLGMDKGIFLGSIVSEDVLSKYKNENQPMGYESSKSWTVEQENIQEFRFVLSFPDESEEPENISIETNLLCKKAIANFGIPCGNTQETCTYLNQHSEYAGPTYEMIP